MKLHSFGKNEFIRSFFGKIRGYQKSFRNYLTFSWQNFKQNGFFFQKMIPNNTQKFEWSLFAVNITTRLFRICTLMLSLVLELGTSGLKLKSKILQGPLLKSGVPPARSSGELTISGYPAQSALKTFQFLSGLLFPFSIWTFSPFSIWTFFYLFNLDFYFYFPFLFNFFLNSFSFLFEFVLYTIAVTFWISSKF